MKNRHPYLARAAIAALVLLHHPVSVCATSLDSQPETLSSPTTGSHLRQPSGSPDQSRAESKAGADLSFADRVEHQRALEEVYLRHRLWPNERLDPKPSLAAVMSQSESETKVRTYLRDSHAIARQNRRPITHEQLQEEMERMAQDTKQPAVLAELFAALENDPYLIAECLARPVLVGRLRLAQLDRREGPSHFLSSAGADQTSTNRPAANDAYTLPVIAGQPTSCIDDGWTATSTTNGPAARLEHTAVWTGTEMIVWGGTNFSSNKLNTGAKYSPSTDSWAVTTLNNAPAGRHLHTAVWTGSEMIVWGGLQGNFNELSTGGKYNPATDSWTATSTIKAPSSRFDHTAVWSGAEMIVWGGTGSGNALDTGGRYDPATNSWRLTATTNAPSARFHHDAVWSGSEMIIWSGSNGHDLLSTGGRYNPGNDIWTAITTTNAPDPRVGFTAVWTGGEMIIWGGTDGNDGFDAGGKYNPSSDSWTATSTSNAPLGRFDHSAVWTGSEMIVWGGARGAFTELDTGGRYNPVSDSWTATSTTGAPVARSRQTAVWSGAEMIVWGGGDGLNIFSTGGRYCAQTASSMIALEAESRKKNGGNSARLTWSGANSTDIDVYRDGTLIETTPNDGTYIDSIGNAGRARYTYQVCEAGTQVCSNDVVVIFKH